MSKLRQQIKAYVAGQLDACTQPDPQNPKAQFRVSAEDGCPACIPPCCEANDKQPNINSVECTAGMLALTAATSSQLLPSHAAQQRF